MKRAAFSSPTCARKPIAGITAIALATVASNRVGAGGLAVAEVLHALVNVCEETASDRSTFETPKQSKFLFSETYQRTRVRNGPIAR